MFDYKKANASSEFPSAEKVKEIYDSVHVDFTKENFQKLLERNVEMDLALSHLIAFSRRIWDETEMVSGCIKLKDIEEILKRNDLVLGQIAEAPLVLKKTENNP